MNKSLLPAVLAAFVLAAATVAPPASADSQTIDGVEWSYTVDGANATVTGANPAEGNLVIPDTLGGATVTAIGDEAFQDCSGLTGVDIPASMARIGKRAFTGCTNLAAVNIHDLVAWCGIDYSSPMAPPLSYAHHLYLDGAEVRDLMIPDSVTSIGDCAFWGGSGLRSVTIPDSVWSIGLVAFKDCTGLTEMIIPDSVTEAGSGAFRGCSNLARMEVPAEWYGKKLWDTQPILQWAEVPETCVVTYRGISPLAVATETLPKGRPGRAYETKLEASGGVAPYTWGFAIVYEESAAASRFAETGTAQDWQADNWDWDLALPFAFPFFGNTYTNAKINSNGLISFGPSSLWRESSYDNTKFLETPIVAVLWADMKTTSGNIYVDSGADAVTVRWAGTLGGNPVNCSATMAKDGTITLSYGAGNEEGGAIGISAGDGTNCVLSAKHQSGSMENAQNIVFTPMGLPPGLSLGTDGALAGTPEAAGTYSFTVLVTDAKGLSARKELSLEVAAPAPVEGVFARLAGTDELEAGEYVITGTKGGGREHYAMADELGGTGTTFIRRYGDSEVAAEGEEEISDPPESIVWTLEEGAQGWTIRNAEAGYVAFKGSGNSATFTAAAGSNACWTVRAGGAEGLFAVENAAKPERVLQYNGTSGQERFACYTNWGSRAQGLAFWKKGGAAKHAIEIDPAIEHGTIATVPAGSAKPGTMVEVTATPDTDRDWQLADVSVTYPTGETYSWSGTPFFFEMPDGDVFVTATFAEGGVPPLDEAFVFGGDETGTVGGVVRFTVAPKEEGAEFFLADFSVPEGSALGMADVATDYPEVRFTPDKAGWFCFVFEVAGEGGFGARCIEVTGGDDPGPGPGTELRITKMEVRGGTVTLGYAGEAKSVEGTDDLTAGDSWRTVPGAAIDAANKTATLPAGKHFLRLSTEEGGGEAEHRGVQLWEGGPFWAETNIGAEKPEDAGLYFWWGDTVGYRREGDAWVASDGSAENFSFSAENTPTYGKNNATLQSEGWITAEGALAPEHDAAQVHWGGGWRMPTDSDIDALINNCDWTWTTRNGVDGYEVRGKGDYASASIFLPAAGYGYGTSLYDSGSLGYCWSSTPDSSDSDGAWYLDFNSGNFYRSDGNRNLGFSVRALRGFAE
ncbi:MAG: leucine-rich repeat protein [Kiritimatiellae bacterium]|nr:leucine-rich repeat protein [Kiritimatiellia bacterium]